MSKKQRGNHEGSVYEEGARSGKPTGRWIAQVWINGQKRRAIATTEAKAKQKLRTMMNDLDSGRIVSDGNLTLDQLLEQWLTKAVPNRNLQQPILLGCRQRQYRAPEGAHDNAGDACSRTRWVRVVPERVITGRLCRVGIRTAK